MTENDREQQSIDAWVTEGLRKDGTCGLCGKGLWESEFLYVITTPGNVRAHACPECRQQHALRWWKFETRTMKLLGSGGQG